VFRRGYCGPCAFVPAATPEFGATAAAVGLTEAEALAGVNSDGRYFGALT